MGRPSAVVLAAVVTTLTGCAGPARSVAEAAPSPDNGMATIAAMSSDLLRAHHFNPADLEDEDVLATEARVAKLADTASTQEIFVAGFNRIWREGPFSHVRLMAAAESSEATAARLDTLRVGNGAWLSWDGDIAVLTVTTMMGFDTVERISAAYRELADRGARALVIDIRANDGGAFAVRPLVGHLIAMPLDAGAFVSRSWAQRHREAPSVADIEKVEPWTGWSLVAFWRDVEKAPLTRLTFTPMEPRYSGPVFVLIGPRTASAAELAADALAATGRTVLVGERTAGRMLSQKPYDLSDGLQLFLPIADYHSLRSGRIEGTGVTPDVEVPAARAMEVALEMARR